MFNLSGLNTVIALHALDVKIKKNLNSTDGDCMSIGLKCMRYLMNIPTYQQIVALTTVLQL